MTDERMAELLAGFVKDPLLPSLSSLVGGVALDRAMVDKEAAAKLEMRATLLAKRCEGDGPACAPAVLLLDLAAQWEEDPDAIPSLVKKYQEMVYK